MRLIAIPLARVRPGATPVTTFLAQSRKKIAPKPVGDAAVAHTANPSKETSNVDTKGKTPLKGDATIVSKAEEEDEGEETTGSIPLTKRIMNKASDFWIGLGREHQQSTFDWKKRTYNLGEKLMDQIEYEEWALKGVDPALGPSLNPRSERAQLEKDTSKERDQSVAIVNNLTPEAAKNVPLLFPPSILNATGLLSSLKSLTAARQPHHRQRLIWCIVGMPFTIPFILVPVIPNLPFFYLLWRAWSHWRAMSSSKYLSEMIIQGRLVPTPSKELDRILSLEAPAATSSSSMKTESKATITSSELNKSDKKSSESDVDPSKKTMLEYEPYLLLKPHTIKELEKYFKLEHQLSIELTRARQQTIKSIQKGQMQKLEEAASGHPEHGDNV